jgi:hypothetical protein
VLGQRRAHPLNHCAIFLFARDEVDHSSGS